MIDWKEKLENYHKLKDWNSGLTLMQNVITNNPDDLDAYLNVNYFLMNLLIEEEYDDKDQLFYAGLLKKYFLESYSKFSTEPEYLFFIGIIACLGEWYYDITVEEAICLMKQAQLREPNNLLFKWAEYIDFDIRDHNSKKKMIAFAKIALANSELHALLSSKGILGKYQLHNLQYWAMQ